MAENPFQDDVFAGSGTPDPVTRLRSAATRIRGLRSQVGADGLTPSASRALLDEVTAALEACASALEGLRNR